MQNEFVNLTVENIAEEHLCCIIRKMPHPGVEGKKMWLAERLAEGHVFRKLDAKGTVFIEYAPLEKAWVPIEGQNYLYIYCLWVDGPFKGKGYAGSLMKYCIEDAKSKGKSGVCMLGAKRQKHWLSNQDFAKRHGFEVVDSTESGYDLLALSFDGTRPAFTAAAKSSKIESKALTIYYDMQCPYILQFLEGVKEYCESRDIPASFILVDTLEKAKALPCAFNNWAVFYNGEFETVNLLTVDALVRILKKR